MSNSGAYLVTIGTENILNKDGRVRVKKNELGKMVPVETVIQTVVSKSKNWKQSATFGNQEAERRFNRMKKVN